ncbi:MAG: ATP-binding cassette domain-containing protein [Verrucomicrobiota bacterium]
MIKLTEVEFSYKSGDFLLEIPNLEIKDGQRLAVIGASGSGKTSLLNLIAGIEVPQLGQVTVANESISSMNSNQRRVFRLNELGLIFQEFELLDYLSCRENILLPYRIGTEMDINKEVLEWVDFLSNKAGLTHLQQKHPKHISHGEKQRVAICRALVGHPKIVLADEPTGNLDPETKGQIMELIFDCVDEVEATFVMVTHDHTLLTRFDQQIDFSKLTGDKE